MSKQEYVVALAGSPNVGKSTLFNNITGLKQHVGNWPGKTVERYEGLLEHHGIKIRIVDLPGTYSLGALSEEEVIAREFIVKEKPNAIIVIVNAIELSQSLYLALQVLELASNVVIAINKIDAAERRGIHINYKGLERALGVPVIPISALNRVGLHNLIERVLEVVKRKVKTSPFRLSYGAIEYYVKDLERRLVKCKQLEMYPSRWAAIRLLEGDEYLEKIASDCAELTNYVKTIRERTAEELGEPPEMLMIERRYRVINELVNKYVLTEKVTSPGFSEFLDSIMLHKIGGIASSIIILLSLLTVLFSINTGFPLNLIFEYLGYEEIASVIEEYSLSGILSFIFSYLGEVVSNLLHSLGAPYDIISLIVDGVIAGVGSVLSFFPLILTVYIAFGFLEDSGIMARIGTVGDRIARKLGLSGKAIIPLILGLGCNVPAIMGTRILENDEEKTLSILLAPLVPCQARLFVLLVFASAFFKSPLIQTAVVALVYLVDIALIVFMSYILRLTLLRRYEPPELLVELPPYHRPSLRVISWYAWDKSSHFIKKAGTIIFVLSVITWILINYGPVGRTTQVSESYAAILGKALSPIGSLMGLPDWRLMLSLEVGFVAKEGMVESIVLMTGIDNPVKAVRSLNLSLPQVIAFLLVMIIYTPCIPTVSAFYQESKSVKLTIILVIYELILALLIGIISYNLIKFIFNLI